MFTRTIPINGRTRKRHYGLFARTMRTPTRRVHIYIPTQRHPYRELQRPIEKKSLKSWKLDVGETFADSRRSFSTSGSFIDTRRLRG